MCPPMRLRLGYATAPAPFSRRKLLQLFCRDTLLHGVTNVTSFSWLTYYAVRAAEALRPELVREFQRGNLAQIVIL